MTPALLSGLVSKISKLNIFKRSSPVHEVLFYGGENEETTKKIGMNNLSCIYFVIVHASATVDVCVPSLRSDTITKCLISLQKKNIVRIRVAIHNTKKLHNIQSLTKHGIEVKLIQSQEKFGHDFILVDANDEDAVAVLGSLDYEVSRVNINRDATVLTSEPMVVKTLQREFERIWNSLEKYEQIVISDKAKLTAVQT